MYVRGVVCRVEWCDVKDYWIGLHIELCRNQGIQRESPH